MSEGSDMHCLPIPGIPSIDHKDKSTDSAKDEKKQRAEVEIKYIDATLCPMKKREIKVKVVFIETTDETFYEEEEKMTQCIEFILESDIPEFSTLDLFGDDKLDFRANDLCDFITTELNKRKVSFAKDFDIEWNLCCEHHYKWYEEYDYSTYHCSALSQELSLSGAVERKVLWCDKPEYETGCGRLTPKNVRAQKINNEKV